MKKITKKMTKRITSIIALAIVISICGLYVSADERAGCNHVWEHVEHTSTFLTTDHDTYCTAVVAIRCTYLCNKCGMFDFDGCCKAVISYTQPHSFSVLSCGCKECTECGKVDNSGCRGNHT